MLLSFFLKNFLVVKLLSVILGATGYSNIWISYLELPAFLQTLIRQPWSIITYMFMHHDFIHLIFNLLTLYWFGKIFVDYFNQKQLVGLYFLGGIGGAIFYLAAFNITNTLNANIFFSYLLGVSASVMAIIFALVRKPKTFIISFVTSLFAHVAASSSAHYALLENIKQFGKRDKCQK